MVEAPLLYDSYVDPNRIESERVIAEIHEAFGAVTRTPDTVSWSECEVLDNYGSAQEGIAARRSDSDTHWSQLIENEDWNPFPGIGGFPFIELDGFKYYLPPTMIRFLRGDQSEWFPGHLLRSIEQFTEDESQWTHDQLVAIAHFIDFMSRNDPEHDLFTSETHWDTWKKAMKRRWNKFI